MARLRVLILIGSFCALGCQREVKGGHSSITIRVPESQNKMSKTGGVGAMAAMPSDRKACYGINVTGPGIANNSSACGPQSGVLAGFVEPGATVEVSVPKGDNRTVELYAYLQNVGDNLPCPALGASLPASHLLNTYSVGTASNVSMSADTTEVYINASFPGVGNYLAATLSLPSTCTATSNPNNPPGFFVSSSQAVVTGTGLKLIGRVGRTADGTTATGTGIKLLKR